MKIAPARMKIATVAVLVNVAAIAGRTGLARTTIYRRYRDRDELLRVALDRAMTHGEPPAEADVGDKLRWLLAQTEQVLDNGIGMGGVASVLLGSDPVFDVALRRALDTALGPVRDQVEMDQVQGRIADHVDADALVTLLLGAYLAESVLRGTPAEDWRERITDLLRPIIA